MQNLRILALLSLCLVISVSACRSSGSSAAGSAAAATPVPEGKGRIYFYRKSAMAGSALRPSVILNGVTVGQSTPGGYFVVDREPGNCEISCSVLVEHTLNFDLAEGQTIYVETRTTMGLYAGHVRPGVVAITTGAAAVAKCKNTGGG